MTLANLFQVNLGRAPEDFRIYSSLSDDTRHLDAYTGPDGELLLAFWPTLGNLYVESGESLPAFLKQGKDWLANFQAWKKSFTVGSKTYRAHAGFVAEYESLRPEVIRCIAEIKPRKILLTGFSQGGAHATLCFRDLLHNFPSKEVSATVFASPRVYDVDSAHEFDIRTVGKIGFDFLRVEHVRDPIPTLPPWLLNYCHVGAVQRIGKKGKKDYAFHEPKAYLEGLS